MSPSTNRRAAAIARLAGIAATMAAAPAIVAGLTGPADAATAPAPAATVIGSAAQAHLATLLTAESTARPAAAADVRLAATRPNPFHQFSQFHEGPFRQGQPFHQAVPFHQAPEGGGPFQQLSEP
ncbi:hypothetical protein D7D52_09670 [Nocardia yunnanensis]|uniref:Uncharacterized protein n=1 Tax=Nocardia yunnanensis TaxID=2382165 RepID=A0A386ZC69_9NOCA|nr:hypothetical protein [Nocardia yunnanensis]AYF74089.1 hypothetical protein D7D52_09670 [Nocardia yunnanensis]